MLAAPAMAQHPFEHVVTNTVSQYNMQGEWTAMQTGDAAIDTFCQSSSRPARCANMLKLSNEYLSYSHDQKWNAQLATRLMCNVKFVLVRKYRDYVNCRAYARAQ